MMPANLNHFGNGGNGNIMEMMKPMLMTMLMVKSTTQSSSDPNNFGHFISMIWSILVIQFIDWLTQNFTPIINAVVGKVKTIVSSQAIDCIPSLQLTDQVQPITASITIIGELETNGIPVQSAVMDLISNFSHTKSIQFKNNKYTVNYSEEIQLNKEIFVQCINQPKRTTSSSSDASAASTAMTGSDKNKDNKDKDKDGDDIVIAFYSYNLNMNQLRDALDEVIRNYTLKMKNKIGKQIYYFNEIQVDIPRVMDPTSKLQTIDYTKMPPCLRYSMKPFYTNRKFSNLFGSEIAKIRKRVDFFKNNRAWYDRNGVPYTLGILMAGQSGAGKTSTIKCLANELDRHIINIHLTDTMTKSQLENLFFSDILHVMNNGQTEQYSIPIDKRIYVLEDVDCQCDIVMERSLKDDCENEDCDMEENGNRTAEPVNKTDTNPSFLKFGSDHAKQAEIDKRPLTVGTPKPFLTGLKGTSSAAAPLYKTNDGLVSWADAFASGTPTTAAINNIKSGNQTSNPKTKLTNPAESNQKITLSFLLNLLDGVLETPGRIVIMSTNWINKLDHALIRPGRFDITAHFGKCEHQMIIDMTEHYFECKLTEAQIQIIKGMEPYLLSPAELSKCLFENFGSIDDVFSVLSSLSTGVDGIANTGSTHTCKADEDTSNCIGESEKVYNSTEPQQTPNEPSAYTYANTVNNVRVYKTVNSNGDQNIDIKYSLYDAYAS